jgi:hypothetical protein
VVGDLRSSHDAGRVIKLRVVCRRDLMIAMDDGRLLSVSGDVARLLDLLALLPPMGVSEQWWLHYATTMDQPALDATYVCRKLAQYTRAARQVPSARTTLDTIRLAAYCLSFFDVAAPALHELLDVVNQGADTSITAAPGRIGARWAADVCATAWRIYVTLEAAERTGQHPRLED